MSEEFNLFARVSRPLVVTFHPLPIFQIACRGAYDRIIARLEEDAPPWMRPATEIDSWIDGEVSWYIAGLTGTGEDFTALGPEDQRMFLNLAAEVLYGLERDDALLREIIVETNENE